ncbi:MAG: GFA family protein [Candidatus Sphingomonas colombiensis]|nr:GFA family protein [Sphingomonas sp.]WEK42811.1 MAG: GFA family protein [Sphingomonas sp.]
MTITGGCRCGACRYELALDVLPPVYACHCHICQRASGSAFSVQALVGEDKLGVTGPVIVHEITTEDRTSVQRICGTCHARLYGTDQHAPTRRRGGSRGHPRSLAKSWSAARDIWVTNYKQGWVSIPERVPQWPEMAPMAEFVAALSS